MGSNVKSNNLVREKKQSIIVATILFTLTALFMIVFLVKNVGQDGSNENKDNESAGTINDNLEPEQPSFSPTPPPERYVKGIVGFLNDLNESQLPSFPPSSPPSQRKITNGDQFDFLSDQQFSSLPTFAPIHPNHGSYTLFPSTSKLNGDYFKAKTGTKLNMNSQVKYPSFSFYVMGDTPYDKAEEIILAQQMSDIEDEIMLSNDPSSFIVHVGDLMRNKACDTRYYKRSSDILFNNSQSLFVLPGDNDWVDCPNSRYAMRRFQKYFIRNISSNNLIGFKRQTGRQENFSLWRNNVLFLGINMIGPKNNNWIGRYRDNLSWFHSQCDKYIGNARAVVLFTHSVNARPVYNEIKKRLRTAGLSVLVLHGNGHIFQTQIGPSNLMKIQVDRGGNAPPIKVSIKGSESVSNLSDSPNTTKRQIMFLDIFKIDRRKT